MTTRRVVAAGLTAAIVAPAVSAVHSACSTPREGSSSQQPTGESGRSTPYGQRGAGRGEPILEPELPIIDALHHLFIRPTIRYMVEEYLADATSGHRIVASVYVEANSNYHQTGPEIMRPLGEVAFANDVGARSASGGRQICAAIVGGGDLRAGAAIGDYLDAALQLAPDRFRGVRQGANHFPGDALKRYMPKQPPAGLLGNSEFRAGLAQVTKRGLTFDTAVFHPQLAELADLAKAFPKLTIVLNHCGLAVGVDQSPAQRQDIFQEWRKGMRAVAQHPNVLCKISGFGLPFWGFGFDKKAEPVGYLELSETWRPYIETVVELFGAKRCMMASDYPSDAASAGFVPLWNAFKHSVRSASHQEKEALFHGTAARTYKIDLTRRSPAP